MISLTPSPIRIADCYEDGTDARHYRFELLSDNESVNGISPGQFFMLSVPGHGEAPFTYVSLPDDEGMFNALVRKTGDLTSALFERNVGDILGYRGAFGTHWPLEELKNKNILCIAGGCGLAPMAALIDQLVYQLDYQSSGASVNSISLTYGSRNPATQVLQGELKSWKEKIPVFEVFEQTEDDNSWEGNPLKYVDRIIELTQTEPDRIICCGPEALMEATAREFVGRGISAEDIWLSYERRMHCGVGLCGHCYIGHEYVCKQGPVYNWQHLQTLMAEQPKVETSQTSVRHCGY